ncbi:MAG: HDOD domain-containing protein [Gallionellaceae bacterium]|jgi:HD-like signal output (HDOD) protein
MHAELSDDITSQALNGITIPPCPASLTSILREAKRPHSDYASLAHLISRDAGVVGPLLKLANSPFIGLRGKVTSVFQAISVLGLQNTINLVQNISLRQSIGDNQNFEKFWERSSLAATIAEKISTRFPAISKDDAYITALFHDCAIPVLIMKFPNYRETVMSQSKLGKLICDIENEFFSTSHTVVGSMLTRSWMLNPIISKAILYHHDATILSTKDDQVGQDALNLIAIVHIAECIADEYFNAPMKEWLEVEHDVLKHLDLTHQEFLELKGDILAFLNGE